MNELFNLFNTLGYPYFRQGSLANKTYPDSFFTFWNYDTPNGQFYDDEAKQFIEIVQVCFYTNNANLIYSVMDQFILAAKNAGFIVNGRAYDTPADDENYFGRLTRINIIHKEE